MKTFNFGDGASGNGPEPSVAGTLSLVPGLGQLYNGDKLKGWLFLEVGAINFALLLLILCADSISTGLTQFAANHHFHANYSLLKQLGSFKLGHPGATLLFMLCLAFIAFSVRDAYDRAVNLRNREIYSSHFLELSEATSGSYLAHFALMGALLLLSVFLLIPAPPKTQVTEIEFVSQKVPERIKPPETRRVSQTNTSAQGLHRKELPVKTKHGESAPSSASASRQVEQRTAMSRPQPKNELKTAREDAPKPSLVKVAEAVKAPAPLPAPLPVVRPIAPTFKSATPTPAAPAPMPLPSPGRPAAAVGLVRPVPSVSAGSAFSPKPLIAMNNTAAIGTFAPPAVSGGAFAKPSTDRKASWMNGGGSPSGRAKPSTGAPAVDASSIGGTGDSNVKPTLADTSARKSGNGKGDSTGKAPEPMGAKSGPDKGFQLAVLPPKIVSPIGDPAGGIANPDAGARPGSNTRVNSGEAPIFGPYMSELQRRIRRAWMPPKMPNSKSTIIIFTIGLNGDLLGSHLQRSSGDHSMDEAAMQAIKNSAPFKHLPPNSPESIDVQFTFDYNVFTGGRQF